VICYFVHQSIILSLCEVSVFFIVHEKMFSLLGLVMRFSQPAPRIFRPAVFFSSTATLFNKSLKMSRDLIKEMLRDKGLPEINVMASNFKKGDLKALKVNFKPVECNNQIIPS
jgi:hypothetical protein